MSKDKILDRIVPEIGDQVAYAQSSNNQEIYIGVVVGIYESPHGKQWNQAQIRTQVGREISRPFDRVAVVRPVQGHPKL